MVGGEISGAVIERLRWEMMGIGPMIALGALALLVGSEFVVLKSGNFGPVDHCVRRRFDH
jgi:uncharacterized protein YgbK (DUF1537 family)